MKEKIVNIIVIAAIIIATIFITKSCEQDAPILDDTKYIELVTKHNSLIEQHKQDSINFYTQANTLTKEISVLKTSKDSLHTKYISSLNNYYDAPDEPKTITEFVEVCNDLVVTQDSIINKQDVLIVEQLDYIILQEIAITDRDSLIVTSNESLFESSRVNQKLEKKLKRTRKIGIGAFFTGLVSGILVKTIK